MKRLSLVLIVAGLLMATAFVPIAKSASTLDLELVAKLTHFRSSFGLESDSSIVQASLVDVATFSDNRYGVPLTKGEAAELQRRVNVEQNLTPAVEWAAEQPEFGGWYMDQLGGGVPVILVAGDPSEFGKSVAQHLRTDVNYRVAGVRNSQRDLQALENRIMGDRDQLTADGIGVVGVALDIRNNVVNVEVRGLTKSGRDSLVDPYGSVDPVEDVPVEPDACVSRLNCAPPKGGIQIINEQNPLSKCTIGFNVMLQGSRDRRILTAGHCLIKAPNVLGNGWKHNGVHIGHGEKALWANNGNYDVGLITQGAIAGDDNLVYWGGNADVPHVRGWRVLAGQGAGSMVCRSAYASGFWCGQVTLIEKQMDVDGRLINHMWVVDFDATPGDSGGPYGMETAVDTLIAYGTHSDSPTNHDPPGGTAWYMPISYAFQGLSNAGSPITLCTDAAICG
jgi:hypothetical protein